MTTVRLRKADLELLATIDKAIESGHLLVGKQVKAWSGFYERLLGAEMRPKRKVGVFSVQAAIGVIKDVLGMRAVLPAGSASQAWYAQMQKRITDSGLNHDLMKEAAGVAGMLWRGPIKVESVIRQADVLLSEASVATAPQDATSPVYMTDL